MEGKVKRLIVSILLVTCTYFIQVHASEFYCEEGCRCTGVAINCSSADLGDVPDFETIQGANIVDLSGNHINELEEVLPWQGIEQLQYLYLNVNSIFYIREDAFATLVNLEYVDLSNNYIELLPSTLFARNLRLRKLLLQGNSFQHNTPVIASQSLQHLDMSFCKLATFGAENVRYVPHLRYLNLQVNNLVYLQPEVFRHHPAIKLVLTFNYWACNCSTVELYRWALDNQPRIVVDEKCNTKHNIHVNMFNKTRGFLYKERCDINEDTFGTKSIKHLSHTKSPTNATHQNVTHHHEVVHRGDPADHFYSHAWIVFGVLAFGIVLVAIAVGVVVGVFVGRFLNRTSYQKCRSKEAIFV